MDNTIFEIGAEGVDVSSVMREIEARVAEKMERGVYSDSRIARAERTNLANARSADEFSAFYLDCLADAVFVDINDFEIHERRAVFSRLLIAFKRLIWKILKFYTYRLWSQQNQVNGLLLSAVENTEARMRERIDKLEHRIAELEAVAGKKDGSARGDKDE